MHKCTIIIPVFNQAVLTRQCLEQVLTENAQVVVVDDSSTDSTAHMLQGFRERILVVRHAQNLGFASSCNDGARLGSGEFLLFLNNDTIPCAGWLDALIGYAEAHPEAAVVGSKLIYPDGAIQHAGVVICQDKYPRHIYTGFPKEHPAVNKSRSFQIVTGACVLIRRDVFKTLEGFDSSFRNGFEDVDFCLRVRQLGKEVHYCHESVVEHLESVSPGRFKRDPENVALYRERWLARVESDDLSFYLADGLIQISYEGGFPFRLRISPLLASIDTSANGDGMQQLVREQAGRIAELRHENARLSIELGRSRSDSPQLRYAQLRRDFIAAVECGVPEHSKVIVISKGDSALLEFTQRDGWHFPQTEQGAYAGHYPGSDALAIQHLEILRTKGAQYLAIPATSLWWLEHYPGFGKHLQTHARRMDAPVEVGAIYEFIRKVTGPSSQPADGEKMASEKSLASLS